MSFWSKRIDKNLGLVSATFTILSFTAFVVIVIVLVTAAIDIVTPPGGTIGHVINIKSTLKVFAFVYGFVFAPGTIVSIVYAIYIKRRYLGRPKSYLLEVFTLIVAVQTVYTYDLLQNL